MVTANFEFVMQQNLDRYAGEWIAVSGNKVVASGDSASDVLDKAAKITHEETMIMRVPELKQILIL